MNPAQLTAEVFAWLAYMGAIAHARWDVVIAPVPWRLVWPVACALGAGLLVGRGRRATPLVERIRRLELDARLRETVELPRESPAGRPLPGVLGVLLGPLVGDAAVLLEGMARRLAPGLVGGSTLERELRLAFPGRGVSGHVWRKVAGALVLGLFWPVRLLRRSTVHRPRRWVLVPIGSSGIPRPGIWTCGRVWPRARSDWSRHCRRFAIS